MMDSKYFTLIVAVTVAAALLVTAALIEEGYNRSNASTSKEPEYVSKVFDKNKITQIDIKIDKQDFEWLLENADQEEYRSCDVTINGASFKHVGLRPKGNSSLRTVMQDDTTDRFSFKLEFDTYVEGQSCFGLSKIALNNMLADNTYMKEYLAYSMFESMGVVTPKYAYANITINGEPWGLYLAVESMEEDFVERNYGSTRGNLYRPEGAGADLVWKGDSPSNYSGIKNGAAYKVTDRDFQKVITMIENLNSGTDLEKYLDVDAVLGYFAVNTFLVNFDNYTGNMKHNYYLYEEDGVCTILPWDFNLAFAGFGIPSAEEAVNYPIDTPVTVEMSQRPLIGKLLEVPEYKELYHRYLQELVENYIDSGLYQKTIENLDRMIADYVKNDPTAFCTFQEYQASLPMLLKFGQLRAASIANQLSGKQPSTAESSAAEAPAAEASPAEASAVGEGSLPAQKVSAQMLDLTALGSMGGGRGNPEPGLVTAGDNGDIPGKAAPGKAGAGADKAGNADRADNTNNTGPVGNAKRTAGGMPPGDQGGQADEVGQGGQGRPAGGRVENGPNMVDMPDRETMNKVREIIEAAGGKELTEAQIAQLKKLGLNQATIERMKNMPTGMGDGAEGGPWQEGNPGGMDGEGPGMHRTINSTQLGYVGAAAAAMAVGVIYALKKKRRKFTS